MIPVPNDLFKIYLLSENDKDYKFYLDNIIKYNKTYWRTMNLNSRINLKSAYHFTNSTTGRYTPNIFYILHEINMEFCKQPYDLI